MPMNNVADLPSGAIQRLTIQCPTCFTTMATIWEADGQFWQAGKWSARQWNLDRPEGQAPPAGKIMHVAEVVPIAGLDEVLLVECRKPRDRGCGQMYTLTLEEHMAALETATSANSVAIVRPTRPGWWLMRD